MTRPSQPSLPVNYEIRVLGHLGSHWSTWFTGLVLSHQDDGTTSLSGSVADQAELHGLLGKVRDLGATLLWVRRIDAPDTGTPATPAGNGPAGTARATGSNTPPRTRPLGHKPPPDKEEQL